jgi:hypothetical protein
VIGRQIGDLGLQVLDLQMGVALGGRHPGVAQQLLHRAQIGPGGGARSGDQHSGRAGTNGAGVGCVL